MLTAERRNKIREILLMQGAVKVSDLVLKFGISEETARRDLNELEREGIIHKNYGGAVVVEELQRTMSAITSVNQRKIQNRTEKTAIASQAAKLVQEEQVILLDAGSTTWSLLPHIKHLSKLTVITNSVDIAAECATQENWDIHLVGGQLNKRAMSLIGPNSEQTLRGYNVDICFLGTSGVMLHKGFTSSDVFEAQIKRVMVEVSSKVVVLADSEKFSCKGLNTFVAFQDVDLLYTTSRLVQETLESLRSAISEVVVCDC